MVSLSVWTQGLNLLSISARNATFGTMSATQLREAPLHRDLVFVLDGLDSDVQTLTCIKLPRMVSESRFFIVTRQGKRLVVCHHGKYFPASNFEVPKLSKTCFFKFFFHPFSYQMFSTFSALCRMFWIRTPDAFERQCGICRVGGRENYCLAPRPLFTGVLRC